MNTIGWFGTIRSSADHGAGVARDIDHPRRRPRRRLPIEAAAGDEQKADVARDLAGRTTVSQCLQSGSLHFLFRQPFLRRHLDQRGRRALRRQLAHDLPREVRIRRRHVAVERRSPARGRSRAVLAAAVRPEGRP